MLRHSRGVALIFPEEEVIAQLANMSRPVNTSMQHCVLKVFPKMGGTSEEKFLSAYNICSATFIKHGYMMKTQDGLSLTAKGMQNNLRHRREVAAGAKNSNFISLVNKLWAVYIDKYREGQRKQWEETPPDQGPGARAREDLPVPDNMIVARPSTTTRTNLIAPKTEPTDTENKGMEGDNK
jgi:hypothetical protein